MTAINNISYFITLYSYSLNVDDDKKIYRISLRSILVTTGVKLARKLQQEI